MRNTQDSLTLSLRPKNLENTHVQSPKLTAYMYYTYVFSSDRDLVMVERLASANDPQGYGVRIPGRASHGAHVTLVFPWRTRLR